MLPPLHWGWKRASDCRGRGYLIGFLCALFCYRFRRPSNSFHSERNSMGSQADSNAEGPFMVSGVRV
jgi:hypothetical protein